MQKEIWKDIPNYEGIYQVSNLGNVKSLSRIIKHSKGGYKIKKEINMKTHIDIYGYVNLTLRKKGVRKSWRIHQLVAMAFLGHTPCGFKLVIDHINDVKTDNRVENLQIVTQRFNSHKTQGKYSSQYKGVHFKNENKKWRAAIVINSKLIHLGYFNSEHEAHLAYQNKLKSI